MSDFGRDYLRLTLEINKHIDGYVDAYLGPADLLAEVESADKCPIPALLDDLKSLQGRVPTDDPVRQRGLEAALRAIGCTLDMEHGREFDYLDSVALLYDIHPKWVDESRFTDAHRELDTLLPGAGSIAERAEARRKGYEVAEDKLLPLLELARDETRKRSAALFPLPDDEMVEIELVKDKHWGAYNYYLGNSKSLIQMNTDLPVSALRILDLFAHEGYPGHHTEGMLKEKLLYKEKGYAEQASALLHSPAAVIAEGIATTALEIIFPDGSDYDYIAEVLLPAAGLTGETPDVMRRVAKASDQLKYISGNAAILYHTGEMTQEQTIDYIQRYALVNRDRAEKSFQFITHPLSRTYVFTYTEGYRLIEAAARGGDKLPIFRQLLTSQLLPSDLEAMATQ